jgi:hypothetical protein
MYIDFFSNEGTMILYYFILTYILIILTYINPVASKIVAKTSQKEGINIIAE